VSLPCDQNPPYKAYLCFGAHPLSILGATQDLRPLLASSYINLICARQQTPEGLFGAAIVPLTNIGNLALSHYCEVDHHENEPFGFRIMDSYRLIQWIIDRIHNRWYVLSHVNHYYIPDTLSYRKEDFLHDGLIFGYDGKEETFQVLLYRSSRTYGVTNVPFSSMAMALTLHGSKHLASVPVCYAPVLLAVRPTAQACVRFDCDAACRNLDSHLSSRPPEEPAYACNNITYAGDWCMAFGYPSTACDYGLNAFSTAVSHIRLSMQRGTWLDMMSTRAIWEHKKILHSNIEFWSTITQILNVDSLLRSYREVVEWANTFHLMCMTFNFDDKRISQRLLPHLDKAAEMIVIERNVLTQCYWALCRFQPIPRRQLRAS
jgi:hypothetical protein